jgi:diaminohydroxyphosphoribosylaminopyrimidine deaminase/5-amino-6-(5-phosphoribosylamino)uracil reductase
MRLALRLARKGLGRTSPNPAVGAVVVAGDRVIGTGWHRRAGTDHAEVLALREAGEAARGATLYVTLEPCAHHGRTPPCVEAVLASGVTRVVAAMQDPDPLVAGRGLGALREAGVEVEVGTEGQAAAGLNEAYLTHRRLGRPFVTYKAAMSLDGRTAAADRTSQWITGPVARRDVQRLRAASDAICVGIGTVLADNPSLTVRPGAPQGAESVKISLRRRPLRVVVDSLARTPAGAKVLDAAAPTLVVVTGSAPDDAVRRLREAGAEVVAVAAEGGWVSLAEMLGCLAARGVVSLLMEGGATLAGSFAAAGLIDRYLFYVAPKLLGGGSAPGVLEGWSAATIGEARPLVLRATRRMGEDLRLEARPAPTEADVW